MGLKYFVIYKFIFFFGKDEVFILGVMVLELKKFLFCSGLFNCWLGLLVNLVNFVFVEV